jgi:hypothetical protein
MKKTYLAALAAACFTIPTYGADIVNGWISSGDGRIKSIVTDANRILVYMNGVTSGCGHDVAWALPQNPDNPGQKFMRAALLATAATNRQINLRCEASRVVEMFVSAD